MWKFNTKEQHYVDRGDKNHMRVWRKHYSIRVFWVFRKKTGFMNMVAARYGLVSNRNRWICVYVIKCEKIVVHQLKM
jgi:hypothetical protein